jgi:hypothetical protein
MKTRLSNVIVISSIIGFLTITSISVFVYFQQPQINSQLISSVDCNFVSNSLLNYLKHPQCSRPLGIEVHDDIDCVTNFDRTGYTKIECEDPNKAWIKDYCMYVRINETNILEECR